MTKWSSIIRAIALTLSIVAFAAVAGLAIYTVGVNSRAEEERCADFEVWFTVLEAIQAGGGNVGEFEVLIIQLAQSQGCEATIPKTTE